MNPPVGQTVIMCVPQDRAFIDAVNAELEPGVPAWVPSIEHTGTACERCGRAVWIGPKQRQLAESVLFATIKLCTPCAVTTTDELGVELEFRAANPDAHQLRPRY